jgi:hypothetical protein
MRELGIGREDVVSVKTQGAAIVLAQTRVKGWPQKSGASGLVPRYTCWTQWVHLFITGIDVCWMQAYVHNKSAGEHERHQLHGPPCFLPVSS